MNRHFIMLNFDCKRNANQVVSVINYSIGRRVLRHEHTKKSIAN